MQGLTLLKNIEHFAKKMDCGSLPIRPTHLISHHPTSFDSVISRNYSTLNAIGEVATGIESETLTAVLEHWMERLEWMSENNGDYYL
jgi:hypothetical protein